MSFQNKGSMPPSVVICMEPDKSGNFVCDGGNDEADFQDAINMLTAGGKILVRKSPDYDFANPANIPYPGITIEGESRSMRQATDITPVVRITASGANDIFTLDTSLITKYLQNPTFRNLWLLGSGSSGHGISSANVEDAKSVGKLTVEDCMLQGFTNATKNALDLKNTETPLIRDNKFTSGSISGHIHLYAVDYIAGNAWILRNDMVTTVDNGVFVRLTAGTGTQNLDVIYSEDNVFTMDSAQLTRNSYGYYIDAAGKHVSIIKIRDRFQRVASAIYTTGAAGGNVRGLNVKDSIFLVQTTLANQVLIYLHNRAHSAHIEGNKFKGAGDADGHTAIQDAGWTGGELANYIGKNTYETIQTKLSGVKNTSSRSKTFQFNKAVGAATDTVALGAATGILVNAVDEGALVKFAVPFDVNQVWKLRVTGVAKGGPIGGGGHMHGDFTLDAGAMNAAYNEAGKSWNLPNFDSEEHTYVADDGIGWIIRDTNVGNELIAIKADDTGQLFAMYEVGSDPDGATNVLFRNLEVFYV